MRSLISKLSNAVPYVSRFCDAYAERAATVSMLIVHAFQAGQAVTPDLAFSCALVLGMLIIVAWERLPLSPLLQSVRWGALGLLYTVSGAYLNVQQAVQTRVQALFGVHASSWTAILIMSAVLMTPEIASAIRKRLSRCARIKKVHLEVTHLTPPCEVEVTKSGKLRVDIEAPSFEVYDAMLTDTNSNCLGVLSYYAGFATIEKPVDPGRYFIKIYLPLSTPYPFKATVTFTLVRSTSSHGPSDHRDPKPPTPGRKGSKQSAFRLSRKIRSTIAQFKLARDGWNGLRTCNASMLQSPAGKLQQRPTAALNRRFSRKTPHKAFRWQLLRLPRNFPSRSKPRRIRKLRARRRLVFRSRFMLQTAENDPPD